jgi:hypothetical protein
VTWEGIAPRLEGELVVVEPLAPAHEDGLWEAASDPSVWHWMPVNAIESRETFTAWFSERSKEPRPDSTRRSRSSTRAAEHRSGAPDTWPSGPSIAGSRSGGLGSPAAPGETGANVEAKLLLMGHAFDELGCMRVEFKTDALNERSRGGARSLPAISRGYSASTCSSGTAPARLCLVLGDRRGVAAVRQNSATAQPRALSRR